MKVILFSFLLVLLLSNNQLFSQKKFEIAGGLGLPELINFKLKYGDKLQIGAGVGRMSIYYWDEMSIYDINPTIYTIDFYFHFVKSNDSIRYKYYLNSGISYWPAPVNTFYDFDISKNLFYYSRLGRTFNLTKQIGINFDLGLMFFKYEETGTGPIGLGGKLHKTEGIMTSPTAGLSCFFKF